MKQRQDASYIPHLLVFTQNSLVLIPARRSVYSYEYLPEELKTYPYKSIRLGKVTTLNMTKTKLSSNSLYFENKWAEEDIQKNNDQIQCLSLTCEGETLNILLKSENIIHLVNKQFNLQLSI